MLRKWVLVSGLLVVCALLTTTWPVSASLPLPEEGPNLLKNPGFEGGFYDYAAMTGSAASLKLGNGWEPWYVNEGEIEPTWKNRIPEYKSPGASDTLRIHSGSYSQQYGITFATHLAGILQRVEGITPGSRLRFSMWGYLYANEQGPENAHMKVGIDPTGGKDPFAPQVVWSPEVNALAIGPNSDAAWHLFSVEAVAEGNAVTVFTYSNPDWPARDITAQWDDASLVVIGEAQTPTNTPPPPPPTPTYGPSPTPRPTPTPRPDGAIVHIVEAGDTLYGIAFEYGVDIEQLRRLNAGTLGPNDMLSIGQEIIVSIPSNPPTATPLPAPTVAVPATAAPGGGTEATPVPSGGGDSGGSSAAGGASICVLAYHDRNGNTFRDNETDEELLPNAEFVVADANGIVAQYTSDGVHEPYCFTGLAAGAYRVIQTAPPGYEPSGPAEWPVAVAEGTSLDIQFGDKRSAGSVEEEAAASPTAPEDTGNSTAKSKVSSVFSLVAKISGVLMLLLALGAVVLFVLNRRRM